MNTIFQVNIFLLPLTKNVCRVFEVILNYRIGTETIKTCHPLGISNSGTKVIIVNFLLFCKQRGTFLSKVTTCSDFFITVNGY